MLTRDIYRPNCGGNGSGEWLAVIRSDGWAIDKKYGTKEQVEQWADNYRQDETIKPSLLPEYERMINRFNNK